MKLIEQSVAAQIPSALGNRYLCGRAAERVQWQIKPATGLSDTAAYHPQSVEMQMQNLVP